MDPLTHAMTSYALKRSAFPRARKELTVAMLIAGTVADLDTLSSHFTPSGFLTFHRTFFHSFAAALFFAAAVSLALLFKNNRRAVAEKPSKSTILLAPLAAALLHLLMDLTQSTAVQFSWPWSAHRYSLDWVASLDLWILGVLLVSFVLPKLGSLVGEEIGAKSKSSRGRLSATLALAAIFVYVFARAALHTNAVAILEARNYRGESPRKIAAYPDETSPFYWRGIVETERALHTVDLHNGPGSSFDPDSARTAYKPDPSPALEAALRTATARRFLEVARFPKASVERTDSGHRITFRAFPYDGDGRSGLRVMAVIDTDPSAQVLDQRIEWDPGSRGLWRR